jgi:hypothetical protein
MSDMRAFWENRTMSSNVLAHLVWDENSMTRLLQGLLTIDDFREVILKIFTRGQVDGNAISQHDIYTQKTLDGLSIPDLAIFNSDIRL